MESPGLTINHQVVVTSQQSTQREGSIPANQQRIDNVISYFKKRQLCIEIFELHSNEVEISNSYLKSY